MYKLLSHTLRQDTPAPGGRRALDVAIDESLAQGHVGNTFYFTTWNHAGTHVDPPAHMLPNGVPITVLAATDLVFLRPLVLDVPKDDDELVTATDLVPHERALRECDLLLIRTNYSRWRAIDPGRYRDHNPGLAVSAARYLAGPDMACLRAVGIDTISLAAAACLQEGIEAHHILFAAERPRPMLIIEDLDLRGDLAGLQRVVLAPIFVEGLDSSPCTVLAEFGKQRDQNACGAA